MKKILYIALSTVALCACQQQKNNVEAEAGRMLDEARRLMFAQDYGAAKDSILTMRERYPNAFDARTQGIIVMDSIELLEAQDSLAAIDSLLSAEQTLLDQMKTEKNKTNGEKRTQQSVKVYQIKQHLDETGAKVKFYLRKIEIDKAKMQKEQEK